LFSELEDWPLGVVDWRSVDVERDLIPSDTVFPTNVAETLQVHHSPSHSWHYLDKQRKDEVLLFKIFDSSDTVAKVCPHAAFLPYESQDIRRPRESVETRAMVYYGDSNQSNH